MSAKDLKELLEHLDDTHELVLGPLAEPEDELPFPIDELLFCWRDAAEEAACALQLWRERPGAVAYAVYRAAADRADAAQAALSLSAAEAGIAR
jgi:hypothetical protein